MPEPDLAPRPALAEDAPMAQPTWGIGDAITGWVLAQVGGLFVGSLILGLSGQDYDDLSLGWIALGQIGLWLGFFGVPWMATRLKGNGIVADLGLRAKLVDLAGVPGGVVTQYAIQLLIFVPLLLLTGLDSDDLSGPARELTDRADDPFGVALLVLIVGIGAPVFEEIFYRGLMQRAVQRRYGPGVAVAVTSLVFGLSHLQPLQAPGLVAFGVVVGVLALRTGRLGPSIAVHVGFNLTAVASLLVAG